MMIFKHGTGAKHDLASVDKRPSRIRLIVGALTFGLVTASGIGSATGTEALASDLGGSGLNRAAGALLVLGLIAGIHEPAAAVTPDWVPAHGRRAKATHQERLVLTRGHDASAGIRRPPGIQRKTCDRTFTDDGALGALLGGLVGGVLEATISGGSGRTTPTMGGAILGGLAEGEIGASMTPADHLCVAKALEFVRDRQEIAWRNPDNGAAYTVMPMRSERRAGGYYCRDYQTTAVIGGSVQQLYGTACRQPDGSWRLVD